MDRMPRQRWLTEEQYHRLFPWRGRRLVGVATGCWPRHYAVAHGDQLIPFGRTAGACGPP